MNNEKFLSSSLSAVEHLRADVDAMSIKFYTIPEAPKGLFDPKYAEKCYTFAAGVSGNGAEDYLVYMALRPDKARKGDSKELDIDTVVFCFESDTLNAAPSGIRLSHQHFEGRTTPLPGYESFTLPETVNDLHSKLITGSISLSDSPEKLINAMSHSIKVFNQLLEPLIIDWKRPLPETTNIHWSNAQLFENNHIVPSVCENGCPQEQVAKPADVKLDCPGEITTDEIEAEKVEHE